MGVSGDTRLAKFFARVRTLRIADGPDQVHQRSVARLEFRKYNINSRIWTHQESKNIKCSIHVIV